jgi:replication fork protection complex subunit Tof1/Swi1
MSHSQWFLEFFFYMRAQEGHAKWPFSVVAEVVERGWIIWVLKRMCQAVEDKVRASIHSIKIHLHRPSVLSQGSGRNCKRVLSV